MNQKTALIHFGCRLNQFESDGIKANLEDNKHTLTQNLREADFVVVNTCTVTNKADYKNRAAIRRAHRLNPLAKIVVTGCYATTDAEVAMRTHLTRQRDALRDLARLHKSRALA